MRNIKRFLPKEIKKFDGKNETTLLRFTAIDEALNHIIQDCYFIRKNADLIEKQVKEIF